MRKPSNKYLISRIKEEIKRIVPRSDGAYYSGRIMGWYGGAVFALGLVGINIDFKTLVAPDKNKTKEE
jgi:hypothetical protein